MQPRRHLAVPWGEFRLASSRPGMFEVHGPERKLRRLEGHMIMDPSRARARARGVFIGRAFKPRAGACSPGLKIRENW